MSADALEHVPLIETVVTTTGSDGVVNCAAMGVRWGEEELVFWPFDATRTLRNLRCPRRGGRPPDRRRAPVRARPRSATRALAMRAASVIDGSVIEEASCWREVVVTEIAPTR